MKSVSKTQRFSLSLKDLLPSIFAGLIIGILTICIDVSLGAMIFSGKMGDFLSNGIGLLLFGALIVGLTVALFSTFTNSIAIPQDSPAAIMAVVAVSITSSMAAADSKQTFATVIAALMVSTILTGVFLWLIGHFNLGQMVRFLPYPVVGGF